jgi:hypothetical protein
VSAALTAAAALAAVRLVVDPEPFAADAAGLLAAAVLVLALVAVTGILLSRGRWSRVLAAACAAGLVALAAAAPLDLLGVAAVLAAGVALGGAAGPWLNRAWLRHRPSSEGPPPAAVALLLGLLAVPVVTALARPGGLGPVDWVLAGAGPVLAWGVGRAWAPALWATRLALVPLGVAAWVAGGLPGGAIESAYTVVVASAAWTRQVGIAVAPIAPVRARRVPFPPELVPAEVLEAAGLDRSGRPKETE